MTGTGGDPAVAQGMLAPGQYHVSVTDVAGSWANGLEGGAGFSFDTDLISAAEPAPEAQALLDQAEGLEQAVEGVQEVVAEEAQ